MQKAKLSLCLLLAVAGIAFYLNSDGSNPFFGNSNKEELKAADSTYKMLP